MDVNVPHCRCNRCANFQIKKSKVRQIFLVVNIVKMHRLDIHNYNHVTRSETVM